MAPMGIQNRSMTICENLVSILDTGNLYRACEDCEQFFCVCCAHTTVKDDLTLEFDACHHYPVVFVDGACSRNGRRGAVSGIGGTFGEHPEMQWSIPIDERVDSNPNRTNQRAELLGAIEGVNRVGDFILSFLDNVRPENKPIDLAVATDSEYVCKGVTEWMPKWKVRISLFGVSMYLIPFQNNGWINSSGRPVSNKDLFIELDEAISNLESQEINVGFWWIARRVCSLLRFTVPLLIASIISSITELMHLPKLPACRPKGPHARLGFKSLKSMALSLSFLNIKPVCSPQDLRERCADSFSVHNDNYQLPIQYRFLIFIFYVIPSDGMIIDCSSETNGVSL